MKKSVVREVLDCSYRRKVFHVKVITRYDQKVMIIDRPVVEFQVLFSIFDTVKVCRRFLVEV